MGKTKDSHYDFQPDTEPEGRSLLAEKKDNA
jgi:hypothetical protein